MAVAEMQRSEMWSGEVMEAVARAGIDTVYGTVYIFGLDE
jgi:hypothetical protein